MSIDKIESTNIFLEPYFNSYTNNYYHIITLNKIPSGPLNIYIKHIAIKNISTKINKANENYCSYVISKNLLTRNNQNYINNEIDICTIENITDIYEFLINNNYTINNELTNILRNNNCSSPQSSIINNKKLLFSINYKL